MNTNKTSVNSEKRPMILKASINKRNLLSNLAQNKNIEINDEIEFSTNEHITPYILNIIRSNLFLHKDSAFSYLLDLLSSSKKPDILPYFMGENQFSCILQHFNNESQPSIQYKALIIAESLLEEKSQFHKIFLQQVNIQTFFNLCTQSNRMIKKHALIILSFIVEGSPESHQILLRFGLLDQLVANLNMNDDENFSLLIKIMGDLLGSNLIDKSYIKQGLPFLCKAFVRDEEKQSRMLGIIRRIINNVEEEYSEILRKCNMMKKMMSLFMSKKIQTLQLSHVIKILGCILSNNKRDILEFVQTPGALKQVNETIQKVSEPIKKLGLWLLEKITIPESLDYIFAAPEILQTLSQITQSGSVKMQKHASLAFAQIIKLSSEEYTEIILFKYGVSVIESIRPLLISFDIEADKQDIICGLETIQKILDFFEQKEIGLPDYVGEEICQSVQDYTSFDIVHIKSLSQEILDVVSRLVSL